MFNKFSLFSFLQKTLLFMVRTIDYITINVTDPIDIACLIGQTGQRACSELSAVHSVVYERKQTNL